MKRILYLLLLFIIIAGCKKNGSDNSKEKETDNRLFTDTVAKVLTIDLSKPTSLDEEFKLKQRVFFDDNVDNFIGIPQDIVVKGDTIYAVDPVKAPGIYAYLKDGSQLFAYCSEGSGPADIGAPFSIRVTDTEISVYDMMEMCIIILDKSGNFRQKIKLPINSIGAFLTDSGGLWVDYSNQEFEDIKLEWRPDTTSMPIPVLEVPKHLKGLTMMGNQLFNELSDHTIIYNPCLEPYVYSLYDGKAYLRYKLDFNGLWPSEDVIQKEYGGTSFARKIRKFPILGKKIYENSNRVAVCFENEEKPYIALYDKLNNNTKTYSIDKDKYCCPMYLTEGELYMLRKDDGLDIISLE